ncbi:MAG: toprim domain-containing protein [Spirochaetales bacterium]|nr:toprim domain-containing protein [Spirochaetales bacterium]
MPVSQPEIDRIRREVALLPLIASYGLQTKKVGREHVCLCPFHAEKTPSLSINAEKNVWHCHGCGAGGDAIEFVKLMEKVDFARACAILQNGRGHLAAAVIPDEKPRPDVFDPQVQRHLKQVMDFYERTLRQSAAAKEYLTGRKIAAAVLEDFRIGYADGSLLRSLPSRQSKEGKAMFAALQSLGIITESGREFLHGYVVVAVTDTNGTILQLYGRRISKNSGRPDHLYLLPHAGILNPRALIAGTVVLVESPIDLFSFYSAGVQNVTCSYGTNGYVKQLVALFAEHRTRVLIAFDADSEGNRAAEKLAEELQARGISSERIVFPDGMDPNAVLVELGAEALAAFVSQANAPDAANTEEQETEPEIPQTGAASTANALQVVAERNQLSLRGERIFSSRGDRTYRIDGLFKNQSDTTLQIVLEVSRGEAAFVDRLDILSAKDREKAGKRIAEKFELEEKIALADLDGLWPQLRRVHDVFLSEKEKPQEKPVVVLSENEKAAALELLRAPDLIGLIIDHFRRCGIAGEETNLLVGYLAATSRLLEKPLHVLYQSSSAAGKTTIMKAVLSMMPEEVVHLYTDLSPAALYYILTELSHTILAIEEDITSDEVRHLLKILKTEGYIRKMVSVKNEQSGRHEAIQFEKKGPVSVFSTSTRLWMSEEDQNRDIICTADESREQTRRIIEMQNRLHTLDGLRMQKERESIQKLHRNAQRLLRPLTVLFPHREKPFADNRHRLRRDHGKYRSLVAAIALLHQYQRPIHRREVLPGQYEEYIEASMEDQRLADRISDVVLASSLDDLPPQTRNFYEQACALVREKGQRADVVVPLTRRDLAERTGLSLTTVGNHLERLRALEFVYRPPAVGKKQQSFEILQLDEPEEAKKGLDFLKKPREKGQI